MDRNFTWGTDIEILTMGHLLNTRVFVYNTVHENWGVYSPHDVDRSLNEPDTTHVSMFIRNRVDHHVQSSLKL